jgi:hypothetical protein
LGGDDDGDLIGGGGGSGPQHGTEEQAKFESSFPAIDTHNEVRQSFLARLGPLFCFSSCPLFPAARPLVV